MLLCPRAPLPADLLPSCRLEGAAVSSPGRQARLCRRLLPEREQPRGQDGVSGSGLSQGGSRAGDHGGFSGGLSPPSGVCRLTLLPEAPAHLSPVMLLAPALHFPLGQQLLLYLPGLPCDPAGHWAHVEVCTDSSWPRGRERGPLTSSLSEPAHLAVTHDGKNPGSCRNLP